MVPKRLAYAGRVWTFGVFSPAQVAIKPAKRRIEPVARRVFREIVVPFTLTRELARYNPSSTMPTRRSRTPMITNQRPHMLARSHRSTYDF